MTGDFKHTLYKIIGERIKAKRISLELSQEDLSSRLDVSRSSISNIEKGRHQIPLIGIYQISSGLGIPITDILPSYEELKKATEGGDIQLAQIIDSADLDFQTKANLNSLINKID